MFCARVLVCSCARVLVRVCKGCAGRLALSSHLLLLTGAPRAWACAVADKNHVFAYVGSELPKTSAEASRKELDDFYDSMVGGAAAPSS